VEWGQFPRYASGLLEYSLPWHKAAAAEQI
jgi:hypothetical protein